MIKAVTVYTDDYFHALKKYNMKNKIRYIAWLVISVVFIIYLLNVAVPTLMDIPEYRYIGICYIGVAVIIFSYIAESIFNVFSNDKKIRNQYFNTLIRYSFDEDEFSYQMENENFNINRRYKYSDIFSVVETDKYFLIYPERNMVLITAKNDIAEGNDFELAKLLAEKTGKKYKRKPLI